MMLRTMKGRGGYLALRSRFLSMMPATEEAPMKVTLSAPSKPYPVTIENETITSSGIRISTRNTTSPV